jgi:membrane dipeptidase
MRVDRRTMIIGSAAVALSGTGLARRPASNRSWYDRSIIIDGLGGVSDPYSPDGQTRLSDRAWGEMKRTGVTAVNQTLLPVGNQPDAWSAFLEELDYFDGLLSANPDRLRLILTAADLRATKDAGRIGIIYGTQDTAMVGTTLDRLAEMRKRGVRTVQLTYNLRNLSGDGALEPSNAGLSRLGHATVERIEKERLLLDLSHGGERTIIEAIAAAKRPMTISHTGARAIYDHPRNVTDEALRALANKGGVAGIYFMPYLVPSSKPGGGDLIRHIEHMANVAGEDHLAIGTDGALIPMEINEETYRRARQSYEQRKAAGFAAPGEYPDTLTIVMDYNRLDRFQQLAADLAKRGWTTGRLEKFFGGNLQRLYREAWGD